MLSYSRYQSLEEVKLKSIPRFLSKLKKTISSLLSRLKFGRKVSIKIGAGNIMEQIDLKSRLGYLSEYSTAMELAKVLEQNGVRVTDRSSVANTTKIYNQKKSDLIKLNAPRSEIARQESAGKVMGQQIFNDIIINAEDLPLLTFDIEMTGDSGKGKTKADLILNITKDSKKVVVDRVMASLKAYKSASINLSNSTFISHIL